MGWWPACQAKQRHGPSLGQGGTKAGRSEQKTSRKVGQLLPGSLTHWVRAQPPYRHSGLIRGQKEASPRLVFRAAPTLRWAGHGYCAISVVPHLLAEVAQSSCHSCWTPAYVNSLYTWPGPCTIDLAHARSLPNARPPTGPAPIVEDLYTASIGCARPRYSTRHIPPPHEVSSS
jgi:hypothetical protein